MKCPPRYAFDRSGKGRTWLAPYGSRSFRGVAMKTDGYMVNTGVGDTLSLKIPFFGSDAYLSGSDFTVCFWYRFPASAIRGTATYQTILQIGDSFASNLGVGPSILLGYSSDSRLLLRGDPFGSALFGAVTDRDADKDAWQLVPRRTWNCQWIEIGQSHQLESVRRERSARLMLTLGLSVLRRSGHQRGYSSFCAAVLPFSNCTVICQSQKLAFGGRPVCSWNPSTSAIAMSHAQTCGTISWSSVSQTSPLAAMHHCR